MKALIALAALVLIPPAASPANGQAPAPVTLRLIASPVDDVMPVLYAQRAGLFQRAGLNVVLERATSGGTVPVAVSGGAADIGKGNIMTIITAHAHNVPLTIIAPAAIYDPKTPDAVLVTRRDAPMSSARDLVGKVVGTPGLSDLSGVAVKAWMEANGADWHTTQFIEVSYPSMVAALEQGRIAAATLIKPFITDAVDSGKAKVLGLFYSAVAPRFLESVWFADSGFVDTHKEAIAAFQRIVAQASAYTNAHQTETQDLLVSWAGVDPQQAPHIPRIVTGTVLDARDIQPVINIAAKYALIPKTFDAREIMSR